MKSYLSAYFLAREAAERWPRIARRHSVVGWVRNMPDGSVEAVVEGPREAVEKVIVWAHHGPPLARVDRVEVVWEEPRGDMDDFIIRYDLEPYTPKPLGKREG